MWHKNDCRHGCSCHWYDASENHIFLIVYAALSAQAMKFSMLFCILLFTCLYLTLAQGMLFAHSVYILCVDPEFPPRINEANLKLMYCTV